MLGFVYLITNEDNGRKYVGQKKFWAKTKKKNKRIVVESNWKSYYGSCNEILQDLQTTDKKKFRREIIRMCKTKSEMNYYELKEQIDRSVLLDSSYYNSFVGTKIHKKHLKHLAV